MNLEFDLESSRPYLQLPPEPLSLADEELHQQALSRAQRYLEDEALLLETIMKVDQRRLYLKFDLGSTFAYCLKYLKLSEAVALNFIGVARKSREVPELQKAIEQGQLSVPKACKIVSVLTSENQDIWIEKAKTVPQARLEKEVAAISLAAGGRMIEKTKPVAANKIKMEIIVDEETMELLKRAQNLEAQSQRISPNLAETLKKVLVVYLEKKDPLRKAEREQRRREKKVSATGEVSTPTMSSPINTVESSKVDMSHDELGARPSRPARRAIPASVKHAVQLRDQGRCQARQGSGEICSSQRYLDLHHLVQVSQGGKDEVSNLITLCRSCHQLWHRRS